MELSTKKAFPVKIGPMTLYCEKMTLQTSTDVSVASTLTGYSHYTNKCRKITKLSFTGRVYNKEKPMLYAGLANNINGTDSFQIIYKNLRFIDCIITGVNAIDSGENFIELTIDVSTLTSAYFLDEVTE